MAGEASYKNHIDLIGLHEPVTKKAKFWQSYVRALKGTDDIRADDSFYKRPTTRALSEFPDLFGKSFSDPDFSPFSHVDPANRIFAPGYRYLPVSIDTYGYSPRAINDFERPNRFLPFRSSSVPPIQSGRSSTPIPDSALLPSWLTERPSDYAPTSRYPLSYYSPRPWSTTDTPGYAYTGLPYSMRPYSDLFNPSPYLPVTRVTRDPWWHDVYGLKPFGYTPRAIQTYPSALRNSYLSPVRNSYLWHRHPLRQL